jgi:two-component system chemotaxis sensor kinase CheA
MDEESGSYPEETEEYIISQLRQTFRDEACELLAEIETALLDLEKVPHDREVIDRVFRALHTIKGSGGTCAFNDVSAFAHEFETFFDLVRKGKVKATKEFIALALSARDQIKEMLDECYGGSPADPDVGQEIINSFAILCAIDDNEPAPSPLSFPIKSDEEERAKKEADCMKLGEILVERGDLAPEEIPKVLSAQKRFGEILVESGLVTPDKVQSGLSEQKKMRELRKEYLKAEETASIRVSTEKLDSLADLVGELVTVQAQLSRTAADSNIPEFRAIAEQVERLSGSLHDRTMSIRMVPFETMFGRFKRLVHDLSRETGKEIELVTEGAETELDKTVIERLCNPLVHLIRNCIDHGIEPPEVREQAGKPRCGTVGLAAVHSGAHVLIRISDDGAGLDREAIRAKGEEKGLIPRYAQLSDRELFSLIFAPGFSTARTVSDISGRGVGLDVVKKAIDSMQGSIEVSSRRESGTEITLKLPLTLAIIDGLLVKIGGESFVLPLSFVKECVELTAQDKKNAHGRHIANVRGEIVPYINLRECFLTGGEPPAIEQIVITETDGHRVGFVVDMVIGGHQTVIKNLGTLYRDVEGISGATILGAGTVALILDVPGLVRFTERDEEQMYHRGDGKNQ